MVPSLVCGSSNPFINTLPPSSSSSFTQNHLRPPVIVCFRNKEGISASMEVSRSPLEILLKSLLPLAASAVVILSSGTGIYFLISLDFTPICWDFVSASLYCSSVSIGILHNTQSMLFVYIIIIAQKCDWIV